MITHLPWTDYLQMPWKNGQGITREVCRAPETERYDWRVSVATLQADGPFSRFSGYLRNISVLEGSGMYLTLDGVRSPLIPPFQATDFRGDSDTFCEVVGGPLLDFNVIYNARTTQASVCWLRDGEWSHQQGTMLLFNAADTLEVRVNDKRYRLSHYDSLRIDAPATVSVTPQAGQRFACITLRCV